MAFHSQPALLSLDAEPMVPVAPPGAALLEGLPMPVGLFDDQCVLQSANGPLRQLLGINASRLLEGIGLHDLGSLPVGNAPPLTPGDLRPAGGSATLRRAVAGRPMQVHVARAQGLRVLTFLPDADPAEAAAQPKADPLHSDFVANVNHELRTPMTTVLGMLDLLEAGDLDDQQQAQVARARGAGRALLQVTETLVEYADLQGGRVQLEQQPFELDGLLRELSAQLAEVAEDRSLDLAFDLDPALPPALLGDSRRLRQVLWHLGSNALKFTTAGHVLLRVQLVSRSRTHARLAFTLEDTGCGIEPDVLATLVETIGQAQSGANRRHGGTGLGLATCRQLLQRMDARLHASSRPGHGSRFGFTVRLPLAPFLEPEPSQGRALVADACESRRRAHVRAASGLGWRVVEAATQEQLLGRLRETRHLQVAFVDASLSAPSAPFAAALAAAALPQAVPVVATGGPALRARLRKLPPTQRSRIAACMTGPATPAMFLEAAAQACSASPQPVDPGRPLAGLSLLLAEDNASSQQLATQLLTSCGARVEVSVDGLDALTSLVAGGRYDAILMDWQMPNMDGLDATREIRQIHGYADIPIIALTANGTVADRAACLQAGMDDHVSKPIDLQELVTVILRYTRPGAKLEVPSSPSTVPAAAARDLPELLVDRPAALKRLGGNELLWDQVACSFAGQALADAATLEGAARAADWQTAGRVAHTLKGQAATVGADALARAAQEAEACFAAAPASHDAIAACAAVERLLRKTLAELPQPVPAAPVPAQPVPDDRQALAAALQALTGDAWRG
jgi:two-component system sensor histidine kinase/response regulator